jgi:hypothetical protein
MLARYRLFLVVAGLSAVAGVAVALAPVAKGCDKWFVSAVDGSRFCPPTLVLSPDWVAGVWAAVAAYALLVGLILSARALASR